MGADKGLMLVDATSSDVPRYAYAVRELDRVFGFACTRDAESALSFARRVDDARLLNTFGEKDGEWRTRAVFL